MELGSTEEQSLLDALRTSEARFRAICEAAPLGIYVSEVPNGVIYVNPAMQRIFGRPAEDLLGEGWKQCLHPDDGPSVLAQRAAHYDRSRPMRVSGRYLKSDGSVIWTQLHAAPITECGELRGYVGMIEDVTEHKALQTQLLMAGRLASVGTMAAGVAHEVNTPLAVMLANLEWVDRHLKAATDEVLRMNQEHGVGASLAEKLWGLEGPLNDTREAAERVSLIMKDLTLFSRPDASDQGMADLERVLRSAGRMASHELKHRARLVHEYDALPWVHGSEARLGQVFLNLLINAAHAIPEGRPDENKVRLRARQVDSDRIVVEVQDSGIGVADEVADRIFDPFFSTKEKNLGTGLGLAICHRIVSDLGGRIEVESAPERGTIFRVHLQVARAVADPPSAPEPRAKPLPRRIRVLVIDDDAAILRSIVALLGDDCEVRAMTNAREALGLLRQGERYDVVLCDLMMPDMNGMEFFSELVDALPEVAEQVVFVTGGAVTNSARQFLDQVKNPLLRKPFSADQLRRALATKV